MRLVIVLVMFLPMLAQQGWANTSNVGTSVANKGQSSVELRASLDSDEDNSKDDNIASRLHLDHGFSDMYALRLVATQSRAPNDNFEYNDFRIEHRFQFFEADRDGWDGGFRLEYVWEDGANKPDQARIRFTTAKQIDELYLRSNLFFKRDVGEDQKKGIATELRWQAIHSVPAFGVKAGIEGFHNVGKLNETEGWETQEHQIGLVVKGKFSDTLSYQTGYLHGVSREAPDHAVKLFLIKKFNAEETFLHGLLW